MSITDIAAAFVTAILAGSGIGGGGLFVIYLTVMGLYSQSDAQALNLVFFISAAVASIPVHLKNRRLKASFISAAALIGCVGTLLGGGLRNALSEDLIRKFFGTMLVASGLLSITRKMRKNGEKEKNAVEMHTEV